MFFLNYSSFAHIIYNYMIKKNMTALANSFFDYLVGDPNYILNEKGEPYNINNRLAGEWFKGETNIYPNLRSAASKLEIIENAAHFYVDVIDDLLFEDQIDNLKDDLLQLIKKADNIPNNIKEEMVYVRDDISRFISRVFLFSITQDNDHNHVKRNHYGKSKPSISDLVNNVQGLFANLPKPIILETPEDLDKNEMIYVNELLKAYGDKEQVSIITREELKSYGELNDNFNRQRKSYYAAESIRESIRDTFQEKDYKEFENFKKDIYDGVIEVVEEDYPNGYARLNKTLSHATIIPLSSLLNMLPGWISPEVKKGACHMLVNDGKIRWVKKDE